MFIIIRSIITIISLPPTQKKRMTEACDTINTEPVFNVKIKDTWGPQFKKLKLDLSKAVNEPEKPVFLVMSEFSRKVSAKEWTRLSKREFEICFERPLGLTKEQLKDFIQLANTEMGVSVSGEIVEPKDQREVDHVLLWVQMP